MVFLNIDIFDDSMALWMLDILTKSFHHCRQFTNKILVIIIWSAVFSPLVLRSAYIHLAFRAIMMANCILILCYMVAKSPKIQHQDYLHKICIKTHCKNLPMNRNIGWWNRNVVVVFNAIPYADAGKKSRYCSVRLRAINTKPCLHLTPGLLMDRMWLLEFKSW